MNMKYRLACKFNPQHPAQPKWYAIPVLTNRMAPEDLNRKISALCTFTPADVEGMFASLASVIPEQVANSGSIYLRGIGTFRIGLKSSGVENPDDFTDSCILGHHLLFSPDRSLLDALQNMRYEKDGTVCAHGINISWLRDQKSDTSNDKITRGGTVHLTGNLIMIGGSDDAVGLKLVSADTGVEHKVLEEDISHNGTTLVSFNTPTDLPDGRYRVRIVTQIAKNPKKPLRSLHAFTYEPILTAVNPKPRKPDKKSGSVS